MDTLKWNIDYPNDLDETLHYLINGHHGIVCVVPTAYNPLTGSLESALIVYN